MYHFSLRHCVWSGMSWRFLKTEIAKGIKTINWSTEVDETKRCKSLPPTPPHIKSLFLNINLPHFQITEWWWWSSWNKWVWVGSDPGRRCHLRNLTPIDMVLHPFRPCNALHFYAQCRWYKHITKYDEHRPRRNIPSYGFNLFYWAIQAQTVIDTSNRRIWTHHFTNSHQ